MISDNVELSGVCFHVRAILRIKSHSVLIYGLKYDTLPSETVDDVVCVIYGMLEILENCHRMSFSNKTLQRREAEIAVKCTLLTIDKMCLCL